MKPISLPILFLLATITTACGRNTVEKGNVVPGEQARDKAVTSPTGEVSRYGSDTPNPPFVAPVAIVDATTIPAATHNAGMAPSPAQITAALTSNMGTAAAEIDVTIEGGMVYLTGEVASEADLQRANYIARALPGVVEVDQRGLKTR